MSSSTLDSVKLTESTTASSSEPTQRYMKFPPIEEPLEVNMSSIRMNYPHVYVSESKIFTIDDLESVVRRFCKKNIPGLPTIYRVCENDLYEFLSAEQRVITCSPNEFVIGRYCRTASDPSMQRVMLDWDDRFHTIALWCPPRTQVLAAEVGEHLVKSLINSVTLSKYFAYHEQLHVLADPQPQTTSKYVTYRYKTNSRFVPDSSIGFRNEEFLPLWNCVILVSCWESLTHMEEKVSRYLMAERCQSNKRIDCVMLVSLPYPGLYKSNQDFRIEMHADVYFYTANEDSTGIKRRGHSVITNSPKARVGFDLAWARPGLNKFIEHHDWPTKERMIPVIAVEGENFYKEFVAPLFTHYEQAGRLIIDRRNKKL
ncbi:hypothetical protein BZA70DRAFT_270695 [Myxozyma melibiosi]|uniref:Uncharacterized protein n=1 Tax=Myxozyma melibiosi TaxID=54550 RepID=A0ABR1FDD8_9ASCO